MAAPIPEWNTVDVEFAGAHSIASDGEIYVIENTGMNEVLVLDNNLKFKQRLSNVGSRPHRTIYDPVTSAFYVIGAPDIFCFKKINGSLQLTETKRMSFLVGSYVRSFKIIDGLMYIVSGNGFINVVRHADGSFTLLNSYPVPAKMAFMSDIDKSGDYFYLTSTQNSSQEIDPAAIRTKNLNGLTTGDFDDIYQTLGFTSVPYFIDRFDGRVFICEIGSVSRIISFDPSDLSLLTYQVHFYSGEPNADNMKRVEMYPK